MAPSVRRQAVVGGSPAPQDAATVALVARRTRCQEAEPMLLCSGALVAPDVVLTAAHCLDIFGTEGQYEVFSGEVLLPRPQGRFVRVVEAVVHPGWVPGTHALDVALLRLAAPLEATPYALPRAEQVPAAGQTARVVGYGETREASAPAGQRRTGETEVVRVETAAFHASPAPGMSCTGDSGGPVLVQHEGREVLQGITVRGDVACRSEAEAVRVDAVREDFLLPYLAQPPYVLHGNTHAPEALCTARCTSSAECPGGLSCVQDEHGEGRCLLLALQEGDYGASCTEDTACGEGGTCARLEAEGQEACRCFTPCQSAPPPGAQGCTTTPAEAILLPLALLCFKPRKQSSLAPRGRGSG